MNRKRSEAQSKAGERANQLLSDPQFLYRANQKIGELGVVGEERNRLVLFLAALTRSTESPASVLVKGSTSSGKTTLVKSVVELFPRNCVVVRSGLTAKALAYGDGSLAQKILFLHEYRCGRDAQLLLRLIQSDGQLKYESTSIRGSKRGTIVTDRVGMPVVLTTTTDVEVYADDETRFLSAWADESPQQNKAIMIALAGGRKTSDTRDLPVWREATAVLLSKRGDFETPPSWLEYVADRLPSIKPRVRRDWVRFISFCKVIALIRAGRDATPRLNIAFSDYCIAHRIFEPVFASTVRGVRSQEMEVCLAVTRLYRRTKRAVAAKEIAAELGWKNSLVYKYLPDAIREGLVEYEPGTREANLKLVRPTENESGQFLPSPRSVMRANPEIGKAVEYCDPFTGETMIMSGGR
jgi:hypothetical protein